MALWLIQSNLYNEEDYHQIIKALKNTNSEYKNIKMIPFSHEIRKLPNNYRELPIVFLGSTTLSEWGRKHNIPGVWWNNNFNFEVQRAHYGTNMLNHDSHVLPFGQIPKYEGERFIRPVDDGKAFSGEIISYDKLAAWQERILDLNSSQLNEKTWVQVSKVKNIQQEIRMFIVDGKVVTGSVYLTHNIRDRTRLDFKYHRNEIEFVEQMISKWVPDRVFVMDIAKVDTHEFKIIEINNANSSGFYDSNIEDFIIAVNNIL